MADVIAGRRSIHDVSIQLLCIRECRWFVVLRYHVILFFFMIRRSPGSTLFPSSPLFRSVVWEKTTGLYRILSSPCLPPVAVHLLRSRSVAPMFALQFYTVRRYTRETIPLYTTQDCHFHLHFPCLARGFHISLNKPPACPLRPIILIIACTLLITASAGT